MPSMTGICMSMRMTSKASRPCLVDADLAVLGFLDSQPGFGKDQPQQFAVFRAVVHDQHALGRELPAQLPGLGCAGILNSQLVLPQHGARR